jgi:hypothetical protein
VAYQALGDGPLDLVITAGTFGSVDLGWEDPMERQVHSSAKRRESHEHNADLAVAPTEPMVAS